MDHLPLPREPLLDPIEVPYRCTELYDGGPMLEYPARNGWQILHGPVLTSYLVDGQKPSARQLEGFLQNYLYFGLLHEVIGTFIDVGEFITTNRSGDPIITTARLDECLSKWKEKVEAEQDPASTDETDWWVSTHKLLQHIFKATLTTRRRHETVIDERIWFSIAVLVETIQQVLHELIRDPRELGDVWAWRTPQNPVIGKFITDEMLQKGWCPFDVYRVDLTTSGPSSLYFLGNLQPTRPGRDHSQCTKDLCMWMTINNSYRTRHARPDCQCGYNSSSIESVRQILEGDEIPLIQEVESTPDSDRPSFQIIPSIPSICGNYVAISHVWGEGLGNPHANELPSCSLKWISDMVNGSSGTSKGARIAFWIDTLSVPIEPRSAHLRAMNRIRKPYTDAAFVLVLDSYLYGQDSRVLSAFEIWARVLCCSWSRRLWTFQEGRLARNLLYQFADRALLLEEVFINMRASLADLRLWRDMITAYRSSNIIKNIGVIFPDYPWKDPDAPEKFRPYPNVRDMRESLQARSVSVIDDEALCLFCNMGFDMELVTDLPVEERMPLFWSQVKDIPVGLVFSTASTKLNRPGLHWAPASFMGDMDTPHWYVEQSMEPRVDGTARAQGLEIQVPGFLFDSKLLLWDESFDILFSNNWLTIQDQNDHTWYFVEMNKELWNQDRKEDPKAGEQLAILLCRPVHDMVDLIEDDPFAFQPSVVGVIGVVTEAETIDRPPKIEIYRHAQLHRFSPAFQRYYSMVHVAVERFVMEELGYGIESTQDEQGRLYEAFTPPPVPEGETLQENIANFRLTDQRRVLCQEYCTRFAEKNAFARDITLKVGHNQEALPQAAFERFGMQARGQLQMRRRNRVRALQQTQLWCID